MKAPEAPEKRFRVTRLLLSQVRARALNELGAAFPFAIGGELSAISLRGRFVNAHRRNFAAQQL
jgi:hypothetical protein